MDLKTLNDSDNGLCTVLLSLFIFSIFVLCISVCMEYVYIKKNCV